jgi:hypothetical protein
MLSIMAQIDEIDLEDPSSEYQLRKSSQWSEDGGRTVATTGLALSVVTSRAELDGMTEITLPETP